MESKMKFSYLIPLILFLFLMLPFAIEYIPKNDILGGIVYICAILAIIVLPILCIGALILYLLRRFKNYFYSTYPYISILLIIFKTF